MLRAIRVTIVISDIGFHEAELQLSGVNIIHRPGNKLVCAVIDKVLCWDGSVNLIGRLSSDATAIRLKSHDFANALLGVLLE